VKKIDIFPHIFPKAYFDKMVEVIPNKAAVRRWLEIPCFTICMRAFA